MNKNFWLEAWKHMMHHRVTSCGDCDECPYNFDFILHEDFDHTQLQIVLNRYIP